jgi:hypothetical protein
MQWQVIVALVVMIPVIFLPVAVIWMDISGILSALNNTWKNKAGMTG